MRVNINLASRKYEDVQRFFVRWGVTLALMAALTLLLGAWSGLKYRRTVRKAKETTDLQQQIAQLQKEREEAIAFENRPENREVTQEKKFWNSQIARRSFSWTQLLNDLQRIMPNRAYLESVQPDLTPDNSLTLRLVIVGEKYEDALELQKKLETSKCFHSPKIMSETPVPVTKGSVATLHRFGIQTNYSPECTVPGRSTTKEGA